MPRSEVTAGFNRGRPLTGRDGDPRRIGRTCSEGPNGTFGLVAMVVGVLQMKLGIPEAMSLKDKRRAVKSLKDRLGGRHNVSVAEVDDLDEYRSCRLAVAMVSNDRRFTDSCLSKIVDEVRAQRSVILADYEIELF